MSCVRGSKARSNAWDGEKVSATCISALLSLRLQKPRNVWEDFRQIDPVCGYQHYLALARHDLSVQTATATGTVRVFVGKSYVAV